MVAHEVAHFNSAHALGLRAHLRQPFWKSEGVARGLWESQLLVEFLGEVKGYRLADIVGDEVTAPSTREAMLSWYHRQP